MSSASCLGFALLLRFISRVLSSVRRLRKRVLSSGSNIGVGRSALVEVKLPSQVSQSQFILLLQFNIVIRFLKVISQYNRVSIIVRALTLQGNLPSFLQSDCQYILIKLKRVIAFRDRGNPIPMGHSLRIVIAGG